MLSDSHLYISIIFLHLLIMKSLVFDLCMRIRLSCNHIHIEFSVCNMIPIHSGTHAVTRVSMNQIKVIQIKKSLFALTIR